MQSEPDGEASYVNCVLVAMGKGSCTSVEIASGQPLPEIADLQLKTTEDLHWVNMLPFKYDTLDPDLVIKILLRCSGRRWYQFWVKDWKFLVSLATSSGESLKVFWLTLSKAKAGGRVLRIEKLSKH